VPCLVSRGVALYRLAAVASSVTAVDKLGGAAAHVCTDNCVSLFSGVLEVVLARGRGQRGFWRRRRQCAWPWPAADGTGHHRVVERG
jgi:hypothetical protein